MQSDEEELPLLPSYCVIVPCRNYGRFLNQAIDSALNQSHPPAAVVVVDDGSVDETGAVIEAFGDAVSHIRLDGRGQAAAWNVAFSVTREPWIAFLDADDYWAPERSEVCLLQAAESHADVVMHDLTIYPGGESWVDRSHTRPLDGPGGQWMVTRGLPWRFVPTSAFMARRSALMNIFPLNESRWPYCADTPLLYLLALERTFRYIPRKLGTYRFHDRNAFARAQDRFSSFEPAVVVENLALFQSTADEVDEFLTRSGSSLRLDMSKHEYHSRMLPWAKNQLRIGDVLRFFMNGRARRKLKVRRWMDLLGQFWRMWLQPGAAGPRERAAVLLKRRGLQLAPPLDGG